MLSTGSVSASILLSCTTESTAASVSFYQKGTLISSSGTNVTLSPTAGEQTVVTVQVTAGNPDVTSSYEIVLTRPLPDCSSAQLNEWSSWTECVASCTDSSIIERTRSIIGDPCTASLVETQNVPCGSASCGAQVDVDMQLNSVSVDTFNQVDSAGRSPLHDAFKATIAGIANVPSTQVEITAVSSANRRALSIVVNFVIHIETATLAANARADLVQDVSGGGFATSFSEEALKREVIVAVDPVSVSVSTVDTVQDVPETVPQVSLVLYWLFLIPSLVCVLCVTTSWGTVSWDAQCFSLLSIYDARQDDTDSPAGTNTSSVGTNKERISELALEAIKHNETDFEFKTDHEPPVVAEFSIEPPYYDQGPEHVRELLCAVAMRCGYVRQ